MEYMVAALNPKDKNVCHLHHNVGSKEEEKPLNLDSCEMLICCVWQEKDQFA